MSPDRQRTPSCCEAKPYSKPASPDTPSKHCSPDTAHQESAPSTTITSKPGFPTYAQYKQIEDSYLASLRPHRREKALISQSLFDRIWAVLHMPDKTTETAQFRFWVRKKFNFGTITPQKSSNSDDSSSASANNSESESTQTVLLHEKNLVAVQEQIYDILCYSHGMARHAGRDKTCLAVRQHYTWIPKELVARFIRACPTCIAKKCGVQNPNDSNATHLLPSLRLYLRGTTKENDDEETDSNSQGLQRSSSAVEPCSAPSPGSHSSVRNSRSDSVRAPTATAEAPPLNRAANQSAPESLRSPGSLPMSREVSLYQGLPNGWQFRHDDLNRAQDEFVHHRKVSPSDLSYPDQRIGRPRVPSIAPVVREFFAQDCRLVTPLDTTEVNSEHVLRPLRPSPPTETFHDHNFQASNIDPALFPPTISNTFISETSITDTEARPGTAPPSSIYRAAAPPPINLRYLNSQKTIQAFLTLRDTHSLTPDSPSSQVASAGGHPLASPANSESSQLSSFPMTVTDSVSPANTALATPTDDVATGLGLNMGLNENGGAGLKGAERSISLILGANASSEAVCHGGSVISL